MSTPNDGGPAFPNLELRHTCGDPVIEPCTGMSLRDYFAGKVLAGFCANPSVFAHNANCGWSLVNCTDADLVGYSLHLADVMLAARAGKGKET